MKITNLFLSNFRNHSSTDIPLDQINVFCGRNAAGKSSIKYALEYLLTGRCSGITDEAGRGAAENLPRDGAGAAEVVAVIDGLGTVSRSTGGGLSVEGLHGSARDQQAALCERLGASTDVISAVINTGRFLSLSPGEQKSLLFALLGLSFDQAKLQEHVPPEYAGVFDRLYPPGLAGGAEVFDRLEKVFREERKAAKKVLKELETLTGAGAGADSGSTGLPPGAWENRELIRQQLADMRRQRDELLQVRARAVEAGKLRQKILADIEAQEKEIARLEREEQELRPGGDERATANRLENLTERVKKLEQDLESARNMLELENKLLAEYKANKEAWEKLLHTVKTDQRCPLGPGITCTADRDQMIEKIKKDLAGVEGLIEKQMAKVDAADQEVARVKDELEKYRAELTEFSGAIKLWEQKVQQFELAHGQLDILRGNLVDVPDYDSDDLAQLEQDIDALGQRIANGDDLVRRLAVEEARRKEQEKLAGRLEAARQEVEALEKLVALFGPKGLRQELLTGAIDRLQARADERMQLLTGGEYRVEFSAEGKDGFRVTVFRNDIPRSVSQLSTSERLRLGVIMQDVLNGLTGLGLLVVDDAETLDPGNKMALINLLLQVRQEYGTIIVLSALGETVPRNPGIPGLAMWLVEDGTVKPLPAVNAKTA